MNAPITHQIFNNILVFLDQNPDGLRWSALLKKINENHPDFHPKTINGCIWKMVEKYPNKVYKPSKGVFRLLKYKSF
ncbi:hypothetical protein HYV31_03535 [candidate division WWE3 bacterium]|nr:hypothetical protein [candidate division WWE3 bacterium]